MIRQTCNCAISAAIVVLIITSLPQLYLCYKRGPEWNGSYYYFDADEFAYSAYINALIDGRPRRNDPYTGIDNGPYESLYSIQFLPAYSIAVPARIFGISSSGSFIILGLLISLTSALALFFFLFEITDNPMLSASAAIGVLCVGALAAQPPWGWGTISIPFPFLRRYLPAVPFPFFFAMTMFVWRALTRTFLTWSLLAGLAFLVLIFSYFFLWTAAVGWLVMFTVIWIVVRPRDWWTILRVDAVIALFGIVALSPYLWLLAHRSPVIEQTQLLEFTHHLDLLRGPELFGIAIAIMIVVFGKDDLLQRDPKVLLIMSFALAPILVFNQQVITGRSLQPIHYERFIANYWSVTAVFLAFGLKGRNLPKRIPLYLAMASLTIGLTLVIRSTRHYLDSNVEVDKGRAVALKLKDHEGLAYISNPLTHTLATTSSNPVLWSRYLYTFSNVDLREQKLRFYKYLYYSGVAEETLRASLNGDDLSARGEIFGLERTGRLLTANFNPLTVQEIRQAVDEYHAFTSHFDEREAATPLLAYAIVSPADNLSNLDKWYERDMGKRVGDFIIYRLRLKSGNPQ